MNKELSDLSKRFLQIMKENNYSGYKFAKEYEEVSESKVTHIRSGRNYPSTEMISALLDKFSKINPNWLLKGEGNMYLEPKVNLPESSLIKFQDISDDELSLYILKNKERILENEVMKLYIDKLATQKAIDILKEDIKSNIT